MVTQGKKFLAAHNHPDPTEYYVPLAKSLSNTQTQDQEQSVSPSPDVANVAPHVGVTRVTEKKIKNSEKAPLCDTALDYD